MSIKLEVTKEAQSQVEQLIASQKPDVAIRVYVQSSGGGCGGGAGCGCGASGGQSFGMAFDRARNGDEVIPMGKFNVVVDAGTAGVLDGGKIDFVQGLEESGFKVVAPIRGDALPMSEESGGGCGCGAGGCC
jgi:Fe-S cluster assembly iron-binding protein IscA